MYFFFISLEEEKYEVIMTCHVSLGQELGTGRLVVIRFIKSRSDTHDKHI